MACNLKTTTLLDCALIGVCAVIRSNTEIMTGVFLPILQKKVRSLHQSRRPGPN